MSKLETSENAEDNEGNSEKSEIVHSCDSYRVVPKFSHVSLAAESMIIVPYQTSSKSTEGNHRLFSYADWKGFP
jgi:hypothetical protein